MRIGATAASKIKNFEHFAKIFEQIFAIVAFLLSLINLGVWLK